MKKTKALFVLDAERNGLRGDNFLSIAAILKVEKEKGYTDTEMYWEADTTPMTLNPWVKENVVPHLKGTTRTEENMLEDFAYFWLQCNQEYDLTVVTHMGIPVESGLFDKLYKLGLIGEFEGPYRWFDTSMLLALKGFNHDSEKEFMMRVAGWDEGDFTLHNALEDARITACVYTSLI